MRYPTPLARAVLLCALFVLPILVFANALIDTDGDGIPDSVEDVNGNGIVDEGETDPYNADTDGGGESDGAEIAAGRNPLDPTDDLTYDADGDGWINAIELMKGTDPYNADTDGDGVIDSLDPFPLDARYATDTNENGLPDEWEKMTGLWSMADQNADTDADGDGLTNWEEFTHGTDPLSADTDRDGVSDADEIAAGTNPREYACLTFGSIESPYDDMHGHWSRDYVARLQRTHTSAADKTVLEGLARTEESQRVFLPDRDITRYEFLRMVVLGSCIPLLTDTIDVPVRFSDVSSVAPYEESPDARMRRQIIYTAVHAGIVGGYGDGTFRPDALINRAEALKILVLASRITSPEEATNLARIFSDVGEDAWYRSYVSTGVWHEIVEGYGDGTFRPDRPITRAESAKMTYMTMTVHPYINGYVFP